jgi:hypothetical protein
LENDPLDRYGSAAELADDLEALVCGRRVQSQGIRAVRRLKTWARQESRPTDVCYFIIPTNLILFGWMTVNAISMTVPGFKSSVTTADIIQCIGLAVGVNLAIPVLCVLRLLGYRWSTPTALVGTLIANVMVPLLIFADVMPSFEGLYENAGFFWLTNHMLILFYGLTQASLLSVSVYADYIMGIRSATGRHRSDG